MQLRRPAAGDASAVADGAADRASAKLAGDKLAYVETYGCQMNVADTEMVLGLLQRGGYGRTDDPARADLILINTCAVREKAEERVFARTSMLAAAARPDVVLGDHRLHGRAPQGSHPRACAVRRSGRRSRRLPPAARSRRARRATVAPVTDTRLDRDETYEGWIAVAAEGEADGVVGHVTIQRGCDKFCTFCVVPYTRGRERGIAAARDPAPGARAGRRRLQGGPAPRPDGQLVSLRGRSASPSCCARSPPSRASSGSASPRPTRSTSPTRSSRPWPRCPRSASTSTCRCRARPTACSSACAAGTTTRTFRRW